VSDTLSEALAEFEITHETGGQNDGRRTLRFEGACIGRADVTEGWALVGLLRFLRSTPPQSA
jgi:hypothetical protein